MNNQSERSRRWAEKNNLAIKGFKLSRTLIEEYADACKRAGVSQKTPVEEAMKNFIKKVNETP